MQSFDFKAISCTLSLWESGKAKQVGIQSGGKGTTGNRQGNQEIHTGHLKYTDTSQLGYSRPPSGRVLANISRMRSGPNFRPGNVRKVRSMNTGLMMSTHHYIA